MSTDNVALQWRKLKAEIQGVWVLFGGTFIDQFSGVLGAISGGVKGIKDALTEMDLSGYFEKAGDAVRGFVNHIAKAITGRDELLKGKKDSRKLFSKFRDDVMIEPEQLSRRDEIKRRRAEIRARGELRRSEIMLRAANRRTRLSPVETTAVAAKVEKVVESGVKWLINTAIPKMQAGFDKVFAYIKTGALKKDWQTFSMAVNTTLNLVSSIFTKISDGLSLVDKAFRNYHENLLKAEIKRKALQRDPGRKGSIFEPSPNDFGPSPIVDFFSSAADNFSRFNEAGRRRTEGTAAPTATAAERFERAILTFSPTVNVDARGNDDAEKLANEIAEEFGRMWFAGEHGALDWLYRAITTTPPAAGSGNA